MINLLPPQKKAELRKEENLKVVLILGFFFLISLVCFALILFSIKIFISGEVEAQKILYNQEEKEFEGSNLQTFQENINQSNEKIVQLESFYKGRFRFLDTFEIISRDLPLGIFLTSLSIFPQSKAGEGVAYNLQGFSPNRDILLQFKANLEQEERFYEINFPPSSWIEPDNINFSASFKTR
ncbi:MAG: hypothetical protein Q7S82_00180 [bacterium]|nr:hypothetical protein [bacterium]